MIDVTVVEKLVEFAKIMVSKQNPRELLIIMDDCLGDSVGKEKQQILAILPSANNHGRTRPAGVSKGYLPVCLSNKKCTLELGSRDM